MAWCIALVSFLLCFELSLRLELLFALIIFINALLTQTWCVLVDRNAALALVLVDEPADTAAPACQGVDTTPPATAAPCAAGNSGLIMVPAPVPRSLVGSSAALRAV